MTDIRRVGDSGAHTVEGNVSGARAARLTRDREKQRQQYEAGKNKIKEQHGLGGRVVPSLAHIDDNFVSSSTCQTINSEQKQQHEEIENANKELKFLRKEVKKLEKEKRKRKMAASLSFAIDDNEEGEGVLTTNAKDCNQEAPKKKVSKNPNVDTSHLPDKERDEAILQHRKVLHQEWLKEQEDIKKQMVEVVYSWWDGSGHRRAMEVRKGTTIGKFLEYVKLQLSPEFPEVRCISSDGFLYVKEDLIIPHHISFYDLITMKARGKSGPLFHFDVHDDIRLVNDARIEKDESHPAKVVDRRWYEKNKHIFPASRWEIFDPLKQRKETQRYTIHGF